MLGSLYSIFYISISFGYEGRYYPYKTINIVNFVNSCTMQLVQKNELETHQLFSICSCICDKIRLNWTEPQYLDKFVGPWWERNTKTQTALSNYAKDCISIIHKEK